MSIFMNKRKLQKNVKFNEGYFAVGWTKAGLEKHREKAIRKRILQLKRDYPDKTDQEILVMLGGKV